jgi:hypothetical protein
MSEEQKQPGTASPGSDESGERRAGLPRGIEQVVALGRLSSYWRERVLADPQGAALEAGVSLTASERSVLAAVPRSKLRGMIGSFDCVLPRIGNLSKLASGSLAAAALGALGLAAGDAAAIGADEAAAAPPDPTAAQPAYRLGAEEVSPAALGLPAALAQTWIGLIGSTADIPVGVTSTTPVRWAGNIPDALEEADDNIRAVRCIFLSSTREKAGAEALPSGTLREQISDMQVWNVNVYRPTLPGESDSPRRRKQLQRETREYQVCIRKYGIKKLPTVIYLAPDGSELGRASAAGASELNALRQIKVKLAAWKSTNKPRRAR